MNKLQGGRPDAGYLAGKHEVLAGQRVVAVEDYFVVVYRSYYELNSPRLLDGSKAHSYLDFAEVLEFVRVKLHYLFGIPGAIGLGCGNFECEVLAGFHTDNTGFESVDCIAAAGHKTEGAALVARTEQPALGS